MILFLSACALLVAGYLFYGAFMEKVFQMNPNNKTVAYKINDGVDYMPMPTWKIFLIQLLNIAGLGPVFGAILGALYGPVCLLWIVFGCIFAGAVHDYMSGMLSLRYKGKSLTFLIETFFGKKSRFFFLFFVTFMLLIVGAIFARSPAQMLADISPLSFHFWLTVIFGYYFLATLLPIDKIIGRFYPIFGLLLIVSTVALMGVLFSRGIDFYPNLTDWNQNPNGKPIFPLLFVTIACGALSGFHATQSPMMARCLKNEKYGRPVFYGAMIVEGFLALIWATLGIAFYQGSAGLQAALGSSGNAGAVITQIAKDFLGPFGSILVISSVVILSITTGDTCFRSARLSCADFMGVSQKKMNKRIVLSALVLAGGIFFTSINISTIWNYFSWLNQTLATLTLWVITIYLRRKKRLYWVSLLPALFMTWISSTYVGYDKLFLHLPLELAQTFGALVTFVLFSYFAAYPKLKDLKRKRKSPDFSLAR